MLNNHILPQVLELLKTDNNTSCIKAFLKLAKNILVNEQCLFLQPDREGRAFYVYDENGFLKDKEELFDIEISDFTHPFSHVVQSKKIKELTNKDLFAWKSNPKFKYLLSFFDLKPDEYKIYPLYFLDSNNLAGLLFFSSSSHEINSCFDTEIGTWIRNVFTIHLNQCAQLSQNIVVKNYLSESLERTKNQGLIQKKVVKIKEIIIGESKAAIDLINNIAKISSSMINTLILGETGTGKELVARSIHEVSDRNTAPFVAINCASIPEHLLESELFGYVKGAFTGADKNHAGLIAAAHQGVLFLDEIGDMPLGIQAKLLRVIETKTYRPLGATQEKYSDFRLVTATHRDLKALVKNHLFRKDLYYRISQYTLNVPTLIERKPDISLLVNHFIKQSNIKNKLQVVGCTDQALLFLERQEFKGNVRELKNIVETICILVDSHLLEDFHFEQHGLNNNHHKNMTSIKKIEKTKGTKKTNRDEGFLFNVVKEQGGLQEALSYMEKKIIIDHLEKNDNKRKKTSELLRVPLRTLAYKCKMYNL